MRIRFTEGEKRVFRRVDPPAVSAFAARHVIVPDGPYAGARFRRDVNPYLAGIMDAFGLRHVREVYVCGAPQTGKTLILYCCLCWCIVYRIAQRMLAMPDDETLTRVRDAKLLKMFRATRPVREVLGKLKGGIIGFQDSSQLFLSSAASSSQRASVSIQDLFLDEESLFRQYAGHGDPVTDFLERCRQYARTYKVMRISKPVGDESTSIWQAFENADEKRRFHVVCPACGVRQVMEPKNIISEHNVKDPKRVRLEQLGRYRCPHCRYHWTDHARDQAVARGEWVADEAVYKPRRIGFHLPAYLSAAVSLSEVRAQMLELEQTDDPQMHQAHANGVQALPFKPVVVQTKEAEVLALRDPDLPRGVLPPGFRAVTLGVDMQRVGFWWLACAWNARLECAIIDCGRFLDWQELHDMAMLSQWPLMEAPEQFAQVWRCGLDTGGTATAEGVSRTEEAYDFLARNGQGVIFGTKGSSHRQAQVVHRSIVEKFPQSRRAMASGLELFVLDTDRLKLWASSRLRTDSRSPIRIFSEADEDLAHQLTAEHQVLERGRRVWKLRHKQNHWFDCLCINHALVHASWTPGLARVLESVEGAEQAEAAPVQEQRREQPPARGRLWG